MDVFIKVVALVILPIIMAYRLFCRQKFNPKSVGAGKRVLVTGASSGIGEHVAYKYAQLGAHLVITARRTHLLEKVAEKCKQLGAQSVHCVTADMLSPKDRKQLVEETEEHLNGLDHLILNHATLTINTFWKNSPEDLANLEDIMTVNFLSYVDVTSQLIKLLKKSKGHIGIVSSVAGKSGISGFSEYCASKFALQGYYAALRQELRLSNDGVSVTVIVYGAIATESAIRLMAQSAPHIKFKEGAASVTDAADVLVEGVFNRVYEVHFPMASAVGNWIAALMPEKMEKYMAITITNKSKNA